MIENHMKRSVCRIYIIGQSSVTRQQCAVGTCFSTESARVSRGCQIHGPIGSFQAVPQVYSSTVIVYGVAF